MKIGGCVRHSVRTTCVGISMKLMTCVRRGATIEGQRHREGPLRREHFGEVGYRRSVARRRAELERCQKMVVCTYVGREEAQNDEEGKVEKAQWVRIYQGTAEGPEIRCRLVAQELGYAEKLDELFAGTPSLLVVKMMLRKMSEESEKLGLRMMGAKCAFLYDHMHPKMYIEFPEQDPKAKSRQLMAKLAKAVYGR